MKKFLSILLSFMLIISGLANIGYAENIKIVEGLNEKLDELWIVNHNTETVKETMKSTHDETFNYVMEKYLLAPEYARVQVGVPASDDELRKYFEETFVFTLDNTMKVHYITENAFSMEYAKSDLLNYLISDSYYWVMLYNAEKNLIHSFEPKGEYTNNAKLYSSQVIDYDGFNFLQNESRINDLLIENGITKVIELKIIVINNSCTCLYIHDGEKEYLIRIYKGQYSENHVTRNWVDEFELYTLYEAEEAFKIISDIRNELNATKPTYEEEALSLNERGLLLGNENGLDLLKPLTRVEAATMLLRAMEESTQASEDGTQTFADVTPEHWGYGAAENAYNLGLIKGVGDSLFAPDEKVTAGQFATMVLRASKSSDFNWEEALKILTEKGIISESDAETMDFFTRGDMAKIIYEAIEKEMF